MTYTVNEVWGYFMIEDGIEGIFAADIGGSVMPMIVSKKTLAEALYPIVENLGKQRGVRIVLKRFSNVTVEKIVTPGPGE